MTTMQSELQMLLQYYDIDINDIIDDSDSDSDDSDDSDSDDSDDSDFDIFNKPKRDAGHINTYTDSESESDSD